VQSLVANLAFGWYEHQKMRSYIDAYFVLTEFQDQKLRALLPDNKIYLKPNFIEVPISIYPAHEKKNYLFVGRLEPSKGIELLLETWLKLPSHFMLTLIGTEDYGIYQQKYQRENIRFLGKQPRTEVLQHMARAKYVLQTSLWVETFGLTIIEALSLGTPVIGFNIGTRPEFIQHEINGFLCEPNDFEQTLLKADDYLLYAQLSENAAQSAQPYYEPTILDQQINLYHQIINSR
jgi:glycosyltransferase involved in cell wall biosynthesis